MPARRLGGRRVDGLVGLVAMRGGKRRGMGFVRASPSSETNESSEKKRASWEGEREGKERERENL